jgi:hypothetical protein
VEKRAVIHRRRATARQIADSVVASKRIFARCCVDMHFHRGRYAFPSRIELPDNIPVQGPETEVVGRLVMSDFMALLNEKERQIVVLLSSGYTRLHDIAAELGYTTHSPISKKLAEIREQAKVFFDQQG